MLSFKAALDKHTVNRALQEWIDRLGKAGSLPTDSDSERLQKAILIFLASIYCVLGGVWGLAYLLLNLPAQASIPLCYAILSAGTLLYFFRSKHYSVFRFCQLMLILILPFFLQWSLGGFGASSAVMIWAILSPIGALMFSGTRRALPWFVAYLLLMGYSGYFDLHFAGPPAKLPTLVHVLFFFLNIGGLSSIAFVLIRYFVRQRELAMEILDQEYRRVVSERERLEKIKTVMSHFIPKTAKTLIERDPEKAVQAKSVQDATVLFLDIENFSTLVQSYSLARVNRAIEAYFSAFFDVILRLGGDVNETAGDGMMVLFLDEDPSRNASNAVQAAQEIQKECKRLSRSGPGDLFPVSIKIGISSGEVYLGSTKMTGSAGSRWTFTASGPVTVLAARLSDYAKGSQILISENTARRVALSFTINPLGRINLKNMDDSGEIYQVS